MRGLEPKFKKSGTRKFSEEPIAHRGSEEALSPSDFRISVPDLELADRAYIKNSKWPSQNISKLIFYSYSNQM